MASSVSIIYWTGPHRMRLVRFRVIDPFHWLWSAYDMLRSALRHAMRSLEPPGPKVRHRSSSFPSVLQDLYAAYPLAQRYLR